LKVGRLEEKEEKEADIEERLEDCEEAEEFYA